MIGMLLRRWVRATSNWPLIWTEFGYLRIPAPTNTLMGSAVKLTVVCIKTNGFQEDLFDPSDDSRHWDVEWIIDANLVPLGQPGRDRPVLRFGGRNSFTGIVRYMR